MVTVTHKKVILHQFIRIELTCIQHSTEGWNILYERFFVFFSLHTSLKCSQMCNFINYVHLYCKNQVCAVVVVGNYDKKKRYKQKLKFFQRSFILKFDTDIRVVLFLSVFHKLNIDVFIFSLGRGKTICTVSDKDHLYCMMSNVLEAP